MCCELALSDRLDRNQYLLNPSARAVYDTRSNFKRSLTGLNSEFSFSKTSCFTKAEEHSLPWRIIGVMPFPRVLVVCEMQSVSPRIWTRVTVSISYDDNHYTTGTSIDRNQYFVHNFDVIFPNDFLDIMLEIFVKCLLILFWSSAVKKLQSLEKFTR